MIAARQAAALQLRTSRDEALAVKTAGLAFVAIFSSLIWMAIIAGAAHVFGFAVSAKVLACTGSAIALFLTTICAPLMLRT